MMSRPSSVPFAPVRAVRVILLALSLAGCTREPASTLDLKVSDGDWGDYQRSLAVIDQRQTREERADFARALQELKLQAMVTDRLSAGPALNEFMRREIAGLTVREVLILGQTIVLTRKQEEEKALVRSIVMNKRLRPRPDDEASASYLATLHGDQARQLHELRGTITSLRQRLHALNPTLVPAEELVAPSQLDVQPELRRDRKKPASSF